jgi:hypothetical protein
MRLPTPRNTKEDIGGIRLRRNCCAVPPIHLGIAPVTTSEFAIQDLQIRLRAKAAHRIRVCDRDIDLQVSATTADSNIQHRAAFAVIESARKQH